MNVRHCGLMVSAPAWDAAGCEFDSWQCQIYIYISHVHWAYDYLGPFGVLWGSVWVHMAWHKHCVKKRTTYNTRLLNAIHSCSMLSKDDIYSLQYFRAETSYAAWWWRRFNYTVISMITTMTSVMTADKDNLRFILPPLGGSLIWHQYCNIYFFS